MESGVQWSSCVCLFIQFFFNLFWLFPQLTPCHLPLPPGPRLPFPLPCSFACPGETLCRYMYRVRIPYGVLFWGEREDNTDNKHVTHKLFVISPSNRNPRALMIHLAPLWLSESNLTCFRPLEDTCIRGYFSYLLHVRAYPRVCTLYTLMYSDIHTRTCEDVCTPSMCFSHLPYGLFFLFYLGI